MILSGVFASLMIWLTLLSLSGCQPSSTSKTSSSQSASDISFQHGIKEAIENFNYNSPDSAVWVGAYLGNGNFILQTLGPDKKPVPIGMISLLSTQDLASPKSMEEITQDIKFALEETKKAKETPGMTLNNLGIRFDTRGLQNHTFGVDSNGLILIDGNPVTDGSDFVELNWIYSTNTLRLVSWEDGSIYLIDNPPSIRADRKGMQIVCNPTTHQGKTCYSLERPTLPEGWEQQASKKMENWP
jgi:hypothetical protein